MNEETLNLMIEYQKSLLKRIADLETELNTKSAFRKLNKAMEKNTSRQKDVDYMMELFARYEENTKDAIRDYLKSYADFTDEYIGDLIRAAMYEGKIYERRKDVYARP